MAYVHRRRRLRRLGGAEIGAQTVELTSLLTSLGVTLVAIALATVARADLEFAILLTFVFAYTHVLAR